MMYRLIFRIFLILFISVHMQLESSSCTRRSYILPSVGHFPAVLLAWSATAFFLSDRAKYDLLVSQERFNQSHDHERKLLISCASNRPYPDNVLGQHNPTETSVSIAALVARRAGVGSQIRVYKFSGGREGLALRHFGSQPALRRALSSFLQRGHRRTLELLVLELVCPRLQDRT